MQYRKNNSSLKTKQLAVISMLLSVAFILSWVEMMIGITTGIPGIKLGLANIIILFTICVCGKRAGLMVLAGRLLLNAILFGNVMSLMYSVAGGLLSYLIMCISIYVLKFGNVFSSICGGVFHNIGQIIVALFVLKTPAIIGYLPYLIIGGIFAGALNGYVVKKMVNTKIFNNFKEKTNT